MKVLVVGSGGREHAICWALKKSPKVTELFCAPGNGGIGEIATCVDVKATDIDGMVAWAKDNQMDFVMVAPDDPLAMGMVDALEAAGIRAFGPRAGAAIIEGSKAFSKGLMKQYGIPTAAYEIFTDKDQALAYVEQQGAPIVVKCDGLALGKGVVVAQTVDEAKQAVINMMENKAFGEAGAKETALQVHLSPGQAHSGQRPFSVQSTGIFHIVFQKNVPLRPPGTGTRLSPVPFLWNVSSPGLRRPGMHPPWC